MCKELVLGSMFTIYSHDSLSQLIVVSISWHKLWSVVHLFVQYKSRKYAHVWATFFLCGSFISLLLSGPNFYFQRFPVNKVAENFLFHHFAGLIFVASVRGANVLWNFVLVYCTMDAFIFWRNSFSISLLYPGKGFISKDILFNTLHCSSACVSL